MVQMQITKGYVKIAGVTQNLTYPKPKVVVPKPLAEWTFGETAAPFRSTSGDLPLSQAGPTNAVPVTSPFGSAISFNGSSFLRLASSAVGRLNIGASGKGAVTVAAWVKHSDTSAGFVGGCWQEDNNDPRRSYGLFYDLNTYGGDEKSNFHVSRTGRPTPGYPFSRDYSASRQNFTRNVWQLHVGTYDGYQAISYLNGAAESYPKYSDTLGNTYSKNPYIFPDGLNGTPCDFTTGAVELTAGPGNYMVGQVAKLRVWDRALTQQQIKALYDDESRVLAPATPTPTPTNPPVGPVTPTEPTPEPTTPPSIDEWLGVVARHDGDSSGIQAQSEYPDYISGIDYDSTGVWPRLVGTGWTGSPEPKNYPEGIDRIGLNRHVGSSTTPDVALRLMSSLPAKNGVTYKWIPGTYGFVTMLCGGNDFGHFHNSGARGEAVYKNGLSALVGIYRSRAFIYSTAANETGTWANSGRQIGERTRISTTPNSTVKFTFTGSNATLMMLAPQSAAGSEFTTKIDSKAAVSRTTKNQGHDTALSVESKYDYIHSPVPVHLRDLGPGTHTVTITHTGSPGDPLIVEALLPWYENEADMPMVIMVPPGKATERGYALYDAPQPNNATVDRFRGYFAEVMEQFDGLKNLVTVAVSDIDTALPYNDYDRRIRDGLHPNKLGMRWVAYVILKTLIKHKRLKS